MSDRRSSAVTMLPVLLALLFAGCGEQFVPPLPPAEMVASAHAVEPVRKQIHEALERALAAPRDASASGQLGMVLSAYGLSEYALACYRRAAALDKGDFRWHYYEAISLGDLGRLEEALVAMERARVIDPEHLDARLRMAGWLTASGDAADALVLYQSVLAEAPHRADARLGLGRLLLQQGDPQAATDQLRAALESDWQVGEVHYLLSRVLRARGDEAGAARHAALFDQFAARSMPVQDPLVHEVAALNRSEGPYLTRAKWYQGQKRFADAAAQLEEALAINPESVPARRQLMEVRALLGQPQAAAAQYDALRAAQPSELQLHRDWARIALRLMDYAAAAKALERALAPLPNEAPQRPDLLAELAFTLEHQGRSAAAAARYSQALALDPDHVPAHAGRGRLLLAAGDAEAALPHLDAAASAPGNEQPYRLLQLARAHALAGSPEAAREALDEARPLAVSGVDPGLVRAIDDQHSRLQIQPAGGQ